MSEHKQHNKDCPVVEELLSPFIDEELNEEADAFVRHHLDSCRHCTEKLDEIKATIDAINSLPTAATPEEDLWPGIYAGASESPVAIPMATGRQRPRWTKPALWAAGVLSVRNSSRDGAARGVLCNMGICYECLVVVDGLTVRACTTIITAGMNVERGGKP